MAVTTNISLHLITDVTAIDHGSFGRPLLLQFRNPNYGDTDLTLFFRDDGLAKVLCDAINAAVARRRAEISDPPPAAACAMEKAAYEAMEASFSRWSGL